MQTAFPAIALRIDLNEAVPFHIRLTGEDEDLDQTGHLDPGDLGRRWFVRCRSQRPVRNARTPDKNEDFPNSTAIEVRHRCLSGCRLIEYRIRGRLQSM